MSFAQRLIAGITVPQQLLIASALTYGAVFALIVEYVVDWASLESARAQDASADPR